MHQILLPKSRLRRLRNSYRHPGQAAAAARLPVAGRRVPMRAYWRRRPLPLPRRIDEAPGQALSGARRGAAAASDAGHRAWLAAGRAWRDRRFDARLLPLVAAAVAAGAVSMYYLDRQQGRRRRALVRDRFAHTRRLFGRELPRRIERRGRFVRGVARGLRHDAGDFVHRDGYHAAIDDETLVQRVRSEAMRHTSVKAGELNIDAYEGCVTLRGQIADDGAMELLLDRVAAIDGVREVRSYLHLPGTLPPNKAAAYERAPEYLRP